MSNERLPHRAPERPNLDELLRRAKATVEAMTPEERTAMRQAQRESWVRGEMAMDESVVRAPIPDAQPEAAREMRERVEAIYWLLQSQDETTDHGLAEKIEAEIIAPLAAKLDAAKLDAANARAAENEEMAQYAGEEQFRAEQAENALQKISLELGGTDEWADQASMIAGVTAHVAETMGALATARAERDRAVADEREAIAIWHDTCAARIDRGYVRNKVTRAEQEHHRASARAIRARATASPVKREGE